VTAWGPSLFLNIFVSRSQNDNTPAAPCHADVACVTASGVAPRWADAARVNAYGNVPRWADVTYVTASGDITDSSSSSPGDPMTMGPEKLNLFLQMKHLFPLVCSLQKDKYYLFYHGFAGTATPPPTSSNGVYI
jgi:hypothetical protein